MPFDHKGNYIPGNHADIYKTPPEDEEPLGFEPPPSGYDDPNKLEDSSELLPSQQKRSDYRY